MNRFVGEPRAYNYLIQFPRQGLFYFEIPKAASTSVKRFLFILEREAPWNLSFGIGHGNWRYLFPECRVEKPEIPKGFRAFSVLRNPYARLRSAFRDKFAPREPGLSLRDFVLSLPKRMELPLWNHLNNHARPAFHFLPAPPERKNVTLFRLEALQPALFDFFEGAGVSTEHFEHFPTANRSPARPESGDVPGTTLREAFDSDMVSIVQDLYAEDFELGPYPKDPL